jgi:hypothetical protein
VDDLVPRRSYDELLAFSTRRGTALRRRRHALQATGPVLTAAVVLLATLWSPARGGTDSLHELPATQPTQGAPTAPDRAARPNAAGTRSTDVGGASSAELPGAGPAGDQPLPQPGVHFSRPGPVGTDRSLGFGDARGDGVLVLSGTGPDSSAGAASADGVDIVAMRFEADADGLRVTMTLAGPHRSDSAYYADLTDSVTGCRLRVQLGGTQPDGFVDECTGQSLHKTPEVVDPSLDVLVAEVPWSMFPHDVSPGHVFTDLDGVALQGLATGYSQADVATTSQQFGPLRG